VKADMLFTESYLNKKQKMTTPMQDVKQLVDHLPESSSIEDIQYHLYVLEKIRNGRVDLEMINLSYSSTLK
jgi:hypothetical protein